MTTAATTQIKYLTEKLGTEYVFADVTYEEIPSEPTVYFSKEKDITAQNKTAAILNHIREFAESFVNSSYVNCTYFELIDGEWFEFEVTNNCVRMINIPVMTRHESFSKNVQARIRCAKKLLEFIEDLRELILANNKKRLSGFEAQVLNIMPEKDFTSYFSDSFSPYLQYDVSETIQFGRSVYGQAMYKKVDYSIRIPVECNKGRTINSGGTLMNLDKKRIEIETFVSVMTEAIETTFQKYEAVEAELQKAMKEWDTRVNQMPEELRRYFGRFQLNNITIRADGEPRYGL